MLSADECVHLGLTHVPHLHMPPLAGGVRAFPIASRALAAARAPRYAPASGQDRPWYQVLGEGRCLGCSWARRMAASSIF
jgi:hypothetical protein